MAMGLKENLEAMILDSHNKHLCKFGSIYRELPEEEKLLLGKVLRSEASTMDITRALNSDGIKIRREFVAEKRKCFLDMDIKCCLSDERKSDCQ